MTQKYHHCPTCGKKGVYLKLQHGEDGYLCRYCQWGVFLDPESDAEKRVLADLEISIRMSRYRNLNEAYDGGWNAHAEHTGAIIKAAENLMDAIENSKRTINHRTQVTDVYFEMESALTELKVALEGK